MVDLGFDIHLGGRASKALHAEVLRELTESDLGLLATERGIRPTAVQRITDRHHALARCLATGMGATEAGLCTGYTASRISVLRGDPAFEELISFYRADKAAPVLDLQQRMTSLALDATAELQDRLELTPESVTTDQLLDTVKLTADRTGNGPKQTNVNINMNLGDRMKAARERAASLNLLPGGEGRSLERAKPERPLAPHTIDGEFTEVDS